MNPASKSSNGGRNAPPGAGEADTKNRKTPNTDMQADDAGTSDSGNDARGTAAQKPMKQAVQPDAESGKRRR